MPALIVNASTSFLAKSVTYKVAPPGSLAIAEGCVPAAKGEPLKAVRVPSELTAKPNTYPLPEVASYAVT